MTRDACRGRHRVPRSVQFGASLAILSLLALSRTPLYRHAASSSPDAAIEERGTGMTAVVHASTAAGAAARVKPVGSVPLASASPTEEDARTISSISSSSKDDRGRGPATTTTTSTTTTTTSTTTTTTSTTTTAVPGETTTTTTTAPRTAMRQSTTPEPKPAMSTSSLIAVIVGCGVGALLLAASVTLCCLWCISCHRQRSAPLQTSDESDDASDDAEEEAMYAAEQARRRRRRSSRAERPREVQVEAEEKEQRDSPALLDRSFMTESALGTYLSTYRAFVEDSGACGSVFNDGVPKDRDTADRGAADRVDEATVGEAEVRASSGDVLDGTLPVSAGDTGNDETEAERELDVLDDYASADPSQFDEDSCCDGDVAAGVASVASESAALPSFLSAGPTAMLAAYVDDCAASTAASTATDAAEDASRVGSFPNMASFSHRSALTEANVALLHAGDEEGRLRACSSIRSHQSRGLSEEESVLLHLYRHRETSDPAFGAFLEVEDDNEDDDNAKKGA
ncbi:Glycoprotein UL132 [Novymonas esmeraldas]|uniref:Glycoprotein UL132 n=1 Tax=Novymonas esmeraldas TaxID=1808958 RepID=A0AAW0F6U2_9TRYP